MRTIAFLLLLAFGAQGATYYVRTDGNNANDGLTDAAGGAWRNVWYAAGNASGVAAGDTVIIKGGFYNDFVTNLVSGSDGSPITFVGERTGAGWDVVIDPSLSLSNGWVAAPDIGTGVYHNTNVLDWTVRELTISGKRCAFVVTNGALDYVASVLQTNWTTGNQLMALPDGVTGVLADNRGTVEFWEGIEALYFSTNKQVYLRLRDGSDPNGLAIRVAPNYEVRHDWPNSFYPAVDLTSRSYITWSNLLVRGAYTQFELNSSDHITLASNYIAGGWSRVFAYQSSLNTLLGNTITEDWYGFTNLGAWVSSSAISGDYLVRDYLYRFDKYLMGNSSGWDNGVYIQNSGHTNTLIHNTIRDGVANGISLYGQTPATSISYTTIASNTVDGFCSVGIAVLANTVETTICDNLISDGDGNIRYNSLDTTDETSRTLYVYRNRFWLPDSIGGHFHSHYNNDTGPHNFFPTAYVYHNSVSGGEMFWNVSAWADENGGATNHVFVDNIISGCAYVSGASAGFYTDAAMVGGFDYHLIYPAIATAVAWFGTGNITNSAAEWANAEGMSFAIGASSLARDAALDVSVAFTVNGRNFSALPDTAIKIGPKWDIGALEFNGNEVPPILRFGTIRSAP